MPQYDILTLKVDEEKVEEIRTFGLENIKTQVIEFKKVYNLSEGDNYCFYRTLQSKMNKFKSNYKFISNG